VGLTNVRLSFVLRLLAAAALVARLGGVGRDWLPPPAWLAVLLLCLHAWDGLWARRRGVDWRGGLQRHGFAIGLGAIVVLAMLVRLCGISLDLGHQPLDIDEHRLASNVKLFFTAGELGHDTVEHYPGVVFWLFVASSFIGYLSVLVNGASTPVAQMPVEMFALSARMANVFVGAATVALVGLLARKMRGPLAGLVAAFAVAVATLSVQTMTVVRNDPGLALLVVAAVYASLLLYERNDRRWALTAGALAGLATGVKYSGLFAVVPPLVASLTHGTARERARCAGLVLAAFAVALAISNHFLWWDFPTLVRQLSDQIAITGAGHWAATANPGGFYTMVLGRFGPGWLLVYLALGFAAYSLSTRRPEAWIFWSFPLLYIWFMTVRPSQFPRWVYPLLPLVTAAGAAALALVLEALRATAARLRLPPRVFGPAAAVVLVVLALAQPVWTQAIELSRRVRPPTYELVETWLRQHTTREQSVLVEEGWLDLAAARCRVHRVGDLNRWLAGGLPGLAADDLVVVSRLEFDNPTLANLHLVQQFHASRKFGGEVGFDFRIYSVPKSAGNPSLPGKDSRAPRP
jgi:4-amino-4-deoxy-L-arabinose transferase-like glycosyltransferase